MAVTSISFFKAVSFGLKMMYNNTQASQGCGEMSNNIKGLDIMFSIIKGASYGQIA